MSEDKKTVLFEDLRRALDGKYDPTQSVVSYGARPFDYVPPIYPSVLDVPLPTTVAGTSFTLTPAAHTHDFQAGHDFIFCRTCGEIRKVPKDPPRKKRAKK